MLSWTQRPLGALGTLGSVKETSQDEETGSGMGSGSLPAKAGAMGPMPPVKAPDAGEAHTLRERFADHAGKPPAADVARENLAECGRAQLHAQSEEQEHPTLADVAKHASMQPSEWRSSPFALVALDALDTTDEDTLEIDMVHERDAAARNDNTSHP